MSDGIPAPNPDFPIPIKKVKGNANIKIQNKNLFDDELLSQEENYNTFDTTTQKWTTNSGGAYYRSFFYNVTGSANQRDITKLLKLKANTTYTLKLFDLVGNNISVSISLGFFDQEGNYINSVDFTTDTKTFTTENECYLDIRRKGNTGSYSFSGIQLEIGSTATDFIPHQEQNLPFTFASGQRAMQGTTLEDNGIHNIRKQKVLLNPTGTNQDNSTIISIYWNNAYCPNLNLTSFKKCSHFNEIKKWGSAVISEAKTCLWSYENTSFGIMFNKQETGVTTLAEAKTFLAEHNIIIEWELAEPDTIPYNATQQAQYNARKEATSYDDITYISSESDELGFNMNVVTLISTTAPEVSSEIGFNNTNTSMQSTNVQDAIVEVNSAIGDINTILDEINGVEV